MLLPEKPKEISAKEIEAKHKKLQADSREFAELLTTSMKQHGVRQRCEMRYKWDGAFATIAVYPYDWVKEEWVTTKPDEKAYAAFSVELKAHMRKTSIRQRAFISPSNIAIEPKIDLYRFDWAADDQSGKAAKDAGPKVATKPEAKNEQDKKAKKSKKKGAEKA